MAFKKMSGRVFALKTLCAKNFYYMPKLTAISPFLFCPFWYCTVTNALRFRTARLAKKGGAEQNVLILFVVVVVRIHSIYDEWYFHFYLCFSSTQLLRREWPTMTWPDSSFFWSCEKIEEEIPNDCSFCPAYVATLLYIFAHSFSLGGGEGGLKDDKLPRLSLRRLPTSSSSPSFCCWCSKVARAPLRSSLTQKAGTVKCTVRWGLAWLDLATKLCHFVPMSKWTRMPSPA